jgi:hypothetical protein
MKFLALPGNAVKDFLEPARFFGLEINCKETGGSPPPCPPPPGALPQATSLSSEEKKALALKAMMFDPNIWVARCGTAIPDWETTERGQNGKTAAQS